MEEYWLWLCSQKELYRPHQEALLRCFGSPREVFEATDGELTSLSFLTESQKDALKRAKREENSWHVLEQKGIRFISIEHPAYPERLKEIPDPPYGIFWKGKLPADQRKSIAMVGARKCSFYGRQIASEIGKALAGCGVQIISGMALGIDSCSQEAVLESGGESFAVLGCGVDVCYPRRNRELYRRLEEQGGIISEFPPGREPLAHHFPIRNRIISGLAETVLVIEARDRSGSLITVDCALEQGRDVMAVPGRMKDAVSSGCNRLIDQGAGIVLSVEHLLKVLKLSPENIKNTKNHQIPLETKEKLVYSCVDLQPVSLEGIIQKTHLNAQETMGVLTALLLKGYVEEPVKNHYKKTN